MKDYDIRSSFEEMELELIRSMKRNLARHHKWEEKEGINWSMWQAEQLKTLEQFKRENQKIFSKKFSLLNEEIKEFLKDTYETSGLDQEKEILNAIMKGKPFKKEIEKGLEGSFFKLNEDKMNALIKATTDDMKKAEYAMLRMTNDQYRKTIFKAQTMANSGAFTLQQSIDEATKDFLKAGINCIQYKDGRRVNIASYAEMAVRTANKRAILISEGDARKAYGIHTVRISRYGQCSETCLPWQGKVYVDDVWSGGTKEEAREKNLPLLSEAIAGGLFHPNCKHRSTTYFYDLKKSLGNLQEDGIENPPEEQEHRKNQLHIQQQKRLETGSLDSQNIENARQIKEQWIEKDKKLGYDQPIVSTYREAVTIEEAQEIASQYIENRFMDKTFKGVADYRGISIENANKINKALADIYDSLDISKISGIKVVSPTSKHGKKAFKDGADAIASYDPIQTGIFLNKDILKNDKAFKEYIKKSDDAWDTVMSNMDKLSESQKEIALRYKEAGRSLVNGDTVEGVIKHEMGHHIQWDVLDTKTNNMIGSKMSEYAPKISGYANSTKGEYIAESFSAYMKGERDIIDPDFVEFLNKKLKVELQSPIKVNSNNIPSRHYNDDVSFICKIRGKRKIEKEYGLLKNDDVVLTDERKHHILERRGKKDFDILMKNLEITLKEYDLILDDSKKNKKGIVFIKKIDESHHCAIFVALSLKNSEYANSNITGIVINDYTLEKYRNKRKIIDKR